MYIEDLLLVYAHVCLSGAIVLITAYKKIAHNEQCNKAFYHSVGGTMSVVCMYMYVLTLNIKSVTVTKVFAPQNIHSDSKSVAPNDFRHNYYHP